MITTSDRLLICCTKRARFLSSQMAMGSAAFGDRQWSDLSAHQCRSSQRVMGTAGACCPWCRSLPPALASCSHVNICVAAVPIAMYPKPMLVHWSPSTATWQGWSVPGQMADAGRSPVIPGAQMNAQPSMVALFTLVERQVIMLANGKDDEQRQAVQVAKPGSCHYMVP